jgi:Flp pilus assembly protein TadG
MACLIVDHRGGFRTDERGAIAIVFALVSVAVIGAVGLAVDVARIVRVHGSLQTSLDQAVIAVATSKQNGDSNPSDRLAPFLTTNWKETYGATPPVLEYNEPDTKTIWARATTFVPTTISNITGIGQVEVAVVSQGGFGVGRAEVALVLDTTGSMAGSRIDALKSAAEELVIETYQRPEADTKIKFSIVPFAQYVNVGTGYRNAPWMSVPNDGPANVCKMVTPIIAQSGCTTRTGYYYDDLGNRTSSYTYEECSSVTYGPAENQCTSVDRTWYGCVGSRATPLDRDVELSAGQPIPGVMDIWCASPLRRLDNNQTQLRNTIRDLTTSGFTYMAPGLMWGWRTLSPTAPFNDGLPKSGPTRARKVIVLMTDGANTTSASSPTHEGWNATDANATTDTVCTKIKDDGVEIFAIAFEVTDPTALDVLQRCASSPITHYFNATDADRLTAAFKRIGESLASVRLTR